MWWKNGEESVYLLFIGSKILIYKLFDLFGNVLILLDISFIKFW